MRVGGTLRVPGDKSISHRSLIFAALADGTSRIMSILQSADVHSTAGVLRTLGVVIPPLSHDFTVRGVGRSGFRQPLSHGLPNYVGIDAGIVVRDEVAHGADPSPRDMRGEVGRFRRQP